MFALMLTFCTILSTNVANSECRTTAQAVQGEEACGALFEAVKATEEFAAIYADSVYIELVCIDLSGPAA